MKKIVISIIAVLLGLTLSAQTNTKLQDPLKATEALNKLDYIELGTSSMMGYHTTKLTFFLRTWTNLANKAKIHEVLLEFDTRAVIEKGEWDYVINCLKYIKDEQLKEGGLDSEYRFALKNGISFNTTKGKSGLTILFPDDTYTGHTITLERIDDWVNYLTAAKEKAK